MAGGRAANPSEGLTAAADSIDSGRALEKLNQLIALSQND
jgi:anthranilate phosphoribosyltransferase